MELQFPIRLTNHAAYFTTRASSLSCPVNQLLDFFRILCGGGWHLINGRKFQEWQEIDMLARLSLGIVERYLGELVRRYRAVQASSETVISIDDVLHFETIISINDVFRNDVGTLYALKQLLGSFKLFVLGVAGREESPRVAELLRAAAIRFEYEFRDVLFLIPDSSEEGQRNLDFFNPVPGAAEICLYPERWPGLLLWEQSGESLFAPLESGMPHLAELAGGLPFKNVKRYLPHAPTRKGVRLLHLSDLHCGTRHTAKKQAYLLSAIKDVFSEKYDRIIITGDLFNSPWTWKWREFENFRQMIRMVTNHDPILIPGNHDLRYRGTMVWRLGSMIRADGELEWKRLELDEENKCIFFCFNSAKKGNFARGEVVEDDLFDAGSEYQVIAARKPEIRNWLRIAIVHHHPYKFDMKAEGWTARILEKLHIPEGRLVDMSESERFVTWCADRGVQLILFGHRHVQRRIAQRIRVRDGTNIEDVALTAIGCGTSLGAEGLPLSFSIVSWDPIGQRWGTEFYMDAHGGGFKQATPERVSSFEIDPLSRTLAIQTDANSRSRAVRNNS
jgi:hypothetical protein